jgi:serine protease
MRLVLLLAAALASAALAKPVLAWVPNDTLYPEQWALKNASAHGIQAERAWDLADGETIVVAVLDSGVTPHSDLQPNLLPGYDFITALDNSADGDGRDGDATDPGNARLEGECGAGWKSSGSTWHGTQVAGVIGAVADNAKGVAGVARAASIVPVRVSGKCGAQRSDIVDAIIWAAGGTVPGIPENPHPAIVINLSLATQAACGISLQRAVDFAVGAGTTVVAGAGNDSADVGGYSAASCNNVIVVAASNDRGLAAGFSNHGAPVDIAAPGESIRTTSNLGTTRAGAESYDSLNGTSFATPMVSGVVALMQSAHTGRSRLSPDRVEALLKQTATPFAPDASSRHYGVGIVNAAQAVEAALRPTIDSPIWEAILDGDL